MNFIDNNGHIFSLESFKQNPIGYEYENNQYIFWIDSMVDNKLSINNYYIKTINIVLPYNKNLEAKLNIHIDSKIFYLLNAKQISELIQNNKSLYDTISINEDDLMKDLSSDNDDMLIYKIADNNSEFLIVPLYVICNSAEEGTWTTNILIKYSEVDSDNNIHSCEWCPITVGGVFANLNEALFINGKNMGVDIPRGINKAIYQSSFYNEEFNEQLYNEKLKEYLLNFMDIKGQIGNFNSVEKSLNWFGYNDNILLTKLYQTDNEFKNQFIRDSFDIENDIIESYKSFRNSTYISLEILINRDTDKQYAMDFTKDFFGEGHPILESLFDKSVLVKNNNINEAYSYLKPFYDYSFTELGLKLACLKYYFEKYFLPVHLSIHSAAMTEKVYANDIKMISNVNTQLVENTIMIGDDNDEVEFSDNHEIYFTHQVHYVDRLFNEYNKNYDDEDIYYINDTCANIPIKFNTQNKFYDCVLLLTKNIKGTYENPYFIDINYKLRIDNKLEIYDKNNNKINLDNIYFAYSFDKKTYSTYYKGYDALRKMLYISNKKYYSSESLDDNEKIIIENIDGINKYYIIYFNKKLEIKKEKYVKYFDPYTLIVPSLDELNINVFDNTKISCDVHIINEYYIKLRYNKNIIGKIIINDINEISGKLSKTVLLSETGINDEYYNYKDGDLISMENDLIFIELEDSSDAQLNYNIFSTKFLPSSELVYESHFQFYQTNGNKQYENFVIYPKYINKDNDIKYFINNDFRISLLVNHKWYYYDFALKIPESIIKLGKLEYNYWDNDEKFLTNFSQLKNLTNDNVEFNSFMHEPKLATVNHINFFDDYIKYVLENNLQYIDGRYINDDDFYYTIQFNDQPIKIHKTVFGKDFLVPTDKLSTENKLFIYGNIEGDTIYLLEGESGNFAISSNNLTAIELENNESEYIIFKYDKENNKYIVDLDDDIFILDIVETIHYSNKDFFNKYIETKNIGNNYKYLNNIHLFDIYKDYEVYNELSLFKNNTSLWFKGVKLTHNSGNKILLNGTFVNDRNINDKDFDNNLIIENGESNNEKNSQISTFNDYDLFSVNEDNLVSVANQAYYEYVKKEYDASGNPIYVGTGKYTLDMYTLIVDDNDIRDFGTIYFKSLNDIENLKGSKLILKNEDIVDEYIKYIDNAYCDNEGNLYVKKYMSSNENIINKYPLILNIEFEKKVNNEFVKYEMTNIEYMEFYNKMKNNTDDNFRIKGSIKIKEGTLHNNICHLYYNGSGDIMIDGKLTHDLIKLPIKKYKICDKCLDFIYPDDNIENRIVYDKEHNIYKLTEIQNKDIHNHWNKNVFCKIINTEDLFKDAETEKSFIVSWKVSDDIKDKFNVNINIDNTIIYGDNTTNTCKFTINDKVKNAYVYFTLSNLAENTVFGENDESFIEMSLSEIHIKSMKFKYDIDELEDDNFEITINDKKYKYGNNSSENIYKLYNDFFKTYQLTFTNINNVLNNEIINTNIYLCKHTLSNAYLDYDFYLMHDNDYWYGLYISKETIDNINSFNDLEISNDDKEFNIEGNNKYKLKYIKSSNEFLLNRMKYIPSNGINQFNNDDLVVAYLGNNSRLPVDIFQSPKWKVSPLSIGISKDAVTESNAEMCLLSLPKENNKYYRGYYTLTVKYCIDKYIQHQYINQTNLLIK